jgi:hypothetical protein
MFVAAKKQDNEVVEVRVEARIEQMEVVQSRSRSRSESRSKTTQAIRKFAVSVDMLNHGGHIDSYTYLKRSLRSTHFHHPLRRTISSPDVKRHLPTQKVTPI